MTDLSNDPIALTERDRWPDALRTLLDVHPRQGWRAHPEFGPLTTFWLQRHLMFRELLDRLIRDSRMAHDGRSDPKAYRKALNRYGGLFVGQLHEHHGVEDHHYFPKLIALEPALARSFDLLDADHHALDGVLDGFVTGANKVLGGAERDMANVAAFLKDLERTQTLLDRHLTDEEEVIVPIILKNGEGRLS